MLINLIYSSLQITLPDSVTKRFHHSMSTYYISNERFWIIVTGGCNEYTPSNNTLTPIIGSDIAVIIQLGIIINIHIMLHVIISDHDHDHWNVYSL